MVYHGPVTEAESYLASLSKPYLLPPGESLADWLIDVSSGRLTPDKVSLQENPAALDVASSSLMTSTPAMALTVSMPTGVPTSSGRRRASAGVGSGRPPPDPRRMRHPQPQSSVGTKSDEDEQDQDHDHAMSTRGPSTAKFEHSLEIAKERRKVLYDCWDEYYKGLTGDGRDRYTPPTPYALPLPVEKPSFWTQLRGQIQRNILITWRNRSAAMVDTSMIVAAVVLISWLQGVTQVTRAQQPGLSFDQLVEGSPYEIPRTFPNLFRYAIGPTSVGVEFALKIGVITSVLLGLTAAKSLTAKRLEFFRESGSGWDINAYFLALNMTSTLEHFFQMVLAAGCAYWLRDSLAPWYSYQVQFIMLMWMTVSWSLLIPLLVPANNTTLAVGFFMAFFGLLFSGGIDPVTYRDIYDEGNSAMAIFTGIVSPTRYFIEGLTVAEQRCLPAQSGFTLEPTSVNFPVELVGSFNLAGLAQNDLSVVQRSCNGWYWGVYPALMVGLSLRFLAAGILHVSDRSKQAKKTLWSDLRKTPLAQNKTVRVVALFVFLVLIMFGISMYLILHQVGQTGILDEPQTEEEAARLVNMTLQGVFPGTQDSDLPPGLGNATSLNSTTSFEG